MLSTFRCQIALLTLWFASCLPCAAQVQNGSFEATSNFWFITGHFPVFGNTARANGGTYYAYTGTSSDLQTPQQGTLYQNITIPSGLSSAALEFYLWVASDEDTSGNWDVLQLQILNETGTVTHQAEAGYYSNRDKSGPLNSTTKAYVKRSVPLTNYIGQTIRIQFKSTVDSSINTIFRIDDVALVTTQALSNLTPYQPSGWSDKIVVSRTAGTNIDASGLTTADSLFVDWSVTNNGAASVGSVFYSRLYLDGTLINTWNTQPPMSEGSYRTALDYSLGSLSSGTHYLELIVDATNSVAESNESNADNNYLKQFTIGEVPLPAVVTQAGTNISSTSVALNGMISNDGGSSIIDRRFDWGTNSAALNQAIYSSEITVAGSSFSANLTGLTSNTTYYFRAWARNASNLNSGDGAGWSRGAIQSFTTSATPNLPIISVTSPEPNTSWPVGSKVEIRWTVTGNNTSAVTGIRLSIYKNGTLFQEIPMGNAASGRDWIVPSTFGAAAGTIKVETLGVTAIPQTVSFTTTAPQPNSPAAYITLPDYAGTPSELPLNVPIRFSGASSQGPPTFYYWYFSDGRSVSGANLTEVTHTFKSNAFGLGWVKLVLNSPTSDFVASIAFSLKGAGNNPNESKSLDPVNTATGAFLMGLDLMPVHGRGLPFLFQAYYNSLSYLPSVAATNTEETPPGALGYGWTHTFETRVQMHPDEDGVRVATIAFGDGHAEKYTLAPTESVWQSQPGVWNNLSQEADGSFSLMTHSQLRHDFDQTNRLEGISDRFGNVLRVVWEDVPGVANARRIQKVVLPGGPDDGSATRAVLFSYQAATPTFLWKLTDPMNQVIEFTQDAARDLVEWKNELTHTTRYTYDGLHQMETGKDGKNHTFVRNFYNADRRVYRQEDPSQDVTLFDYNFPADSTSDRVTTITRLAAPTHAANDPRNEVTVDIHDAKLRRKEQRVRIDDPDNAGQVIWLSEKWAYDDVTSEVTSRTNRRNLTTFFTWQNGNLIRTQTPDGGVRTLDYTDPANPTLPTLITYPDTQVKEKREYNAAGALTAVTFPFDPAQPTLNRRSFTVDAYGQVTLKTDANNKQQVSEFDVWGRAFRFTDGESKISTTEFNDNGQRTAFIDARSNRSETLYNAAGNVWKTFQNDPVNPGQQIVSEITYDENEKAIQASDPLAHLTYSHRDEHGRVWKSEDHEHNTTLHRFDAFGREVETENAKGGITRRTFNFAGYLLSESSPAPSTNVIAYKRDANGNATEIKDGDGVRTTFEYDSMDRAIVTKRWKSATEYDQTRTSYNLLGQKEWDEDAGDALGVKRKVFYHYNLAGDHIRTVMKSGTEFTFDYDFEGHLISASHMSSSGIATRTQEYNGRYQLKKRTNENGHSEEFFYDDAGNLSRHVQESDSATPLETTFVHDSLNRLTQINPPTGPPITFIYDKASRRIEMSDSTGTTKWTYSTLDQVASIEMPNGLKLTFAYDPLGATETITYPGNRPATYVTDAAGRFQSVTDWASRTISQTYTAGDRPLRLQFPNGVHTALAHDPLGRLNVVTHQKGSDPALRHLSYGFNALGQLDSIPDVQLTEPESTYPCTYGKANELLTIAGSPVTHDGRGNLKTAKLSPGSPATDTLTWDYANRLTSGSIGGASFTNTFNGLGHRTATTRSGVTTGFLHDDRHAMPRIMAETDAAGTPTAFYLYAGDTLLVRILPDGSALWYHPDRQGNVVLLTDGSGSTAADYQYDPFGVPVSASGSFAASNRFRYLGGLGVWDNDDGTLHARARSYHPRLGRFLSNDPLFGSIQDGQSLNRYVYALGDPFGFSDPSGFKPVSEPFYHWTQAQWVDDAIILAQFWQEVSINGGKAIAAEIALNYATAGTVRLYQAYRAVKGAGYAFTFLKRTENVVAVGKRGPKTNPFAPHNSAIREEANQLVAEGNTILSGGGVLPEKLIPIPAGGFKSGRRPDILYKTADGIVKAINVGLTKADGLPIKRELEALSDLNSAGIETAFKAYFKQ
jgi:RHS repeat-associated protein